MLGPPPGTRGLRAQLSPAENLTGLQNKTENRHTTDLGTMRISCGHHRRNTLGQMTIYILYCFHGCGWKEAVPYLSGVLGLPMIRRGERILGSKENFSLMFSRTDGAT